MYELRYEPKFKADYKRFAHEHPELVGEFRELVRELATDGKLSQAYQPHVLSKSGGLYNGCIDAHLSDGEVDVIVIYVPHRSNPVIRFVRIGTHDDIFRGRQR